MNGDDVRDLQHFLHEEGYFRGDFNGIYGPLTEDGVRRWQEREGIADASSGWGIFGSRSRAWLARWCGGPVSTGSLRVSPSVGPSPLTVTFTLTERIVGSTTLAIDFGDNSSGTFSQNSCAGIAAIAEDRDGIRCTLTATHTYAANGVYTARATKNNCPQGAQCFAGPITIGTATVRVGSPLCNGCVSTTSTGWTPPGTGYFGASPTLGPAPLQVLFIIGHVNFSGIDYGDGSSENAPPLQLGSTWSPTHSYKNTGTYTARLLRSCGTTADCTTTLGSVIINVRDGAMSCPQYSPPLCAPGQVLRAGELLADGCYGAPRCVGASNGSQNTDQEGTLSCRGANGIYNNGVSVDGQLITGGPFTMSVTWPQYTCRNGYWVCTSYCGPDRDGHSYWYQPGSPYGILEDGA